MPLSRQNRRMVDDKMQAGYLAMEKGDTRQAARLWLETWEAILEIMDKEQIRTLDEFDGSFGGILKEGLMMPDVRDRQWLLESLADLYDETGRKQEAETTREEISQVQGPTKTPITTPGPGYVRITHRSSAWRTRPHMVSSDLKVNVPSLERSWRT